MLLLTLMVCLHILFLGALFATPATERTFWNGAAVGINGVLAVLWFVLLILYVMA